MISFALARRSAAGNRERVTLPLQRVFERPARGFLPGAFARGIVGRRVTHAKVGKSCGCMQEVVLCD